MVGWFSTNHAVCSGNNRQLCCRYLSSSDYPRFWNQFRECENKTDIVIVLYAPNKPALPEKLRMD